MSNDAATIDLDEHGSDFILSRTDSSGQKSSMLLSESDVLTLAQSAQQLKDRIHARHNPKEGGVTRGTVTPVAQVRLNTDIHQMEVMMGMIDGRGAEMEFSLPLVVA